MLTLRTQLQNAILALAKAGKFYPVVYDPASGQARLEETPCKPKTALVNEVSSDFDKDVRYGRAEAAMRIRWVFDLFLEFPREVSLVDFEESLLNPIPRVNISTEGPWETAAVRIRQSIVEHPPQQSADSGTKARIVFEVSPGRN
jgi:hypothetical protein